MKLSVAVILAVACMVGLAVADYGSYMPYYPSAQTTGGFGNGGFLMLIGFLFILLVLFQSGGGQDTITLVNVTTK